MKRSYTRRDPTIVAAVAAWDAERQRARRMYKAFGTNEEKARELGMTLKNFEQLLYLAREHAQDKANGGRPASRGYLSA